MSGDSGVTVFIGLAIFILFLLANRAKKKQTEEFITPPVEEPVEKKRIVKKTRPLMLSDLEKAPVYVVEKRTKKAVLQKGWNRKGSIQQAFVLSEIFRKVDF